MIVVAYVLVLIIVVSLAGISLEPLMMVGVIQRHPTYFKVWFVLAIVALLSSAMNAAAFLLLVAMSSMIVLAPGLPEWHIFQAKILNWVNFGGKMLAFFTYVHLVYFVSNWYIFHRFGMLY
jgi:hypothetical protein